MTAMFGYFYGFVSKVANDHPWAWTLSIVAAIWLVIGINRLALWFYMKYSPSIFSRDDGQNATLR
jgi:hypothetical protein